MQSSLLVADLPPSGNAAGLLPLCSHSVSDRKCVQYPLDPSQTGNWLVVKDQTARHPPPPCLQWRV